MRKKQEENNISSVLAQWSWTRSKLHIRTQTIKYKTQALKLLYKKHEQVWRVEREKECKLGLNSLLSSSLSVSSVENSSCFSEKNKCLSSFFSVFCHHGLHSGGVTRHLHMATPIQKPSPHLSDGVGEHHGGESMTSVSEVFSYFVQGGVPHVHTL